MNKNNKSEQKMVKVISSTSNINNHYRLRKTTMSSVKFIVVLGQCFALLPVNGVNSKKQIDLKFTWKSWKVIYTVCNLLATVFLILMGTVYFYTTGFGFPQFVEHVFYISALLTTIFFIKLARHWPKLLEEFVKVDLSMEKNYGYPKYLDRKLKIGSFIVMFLAIVEYQLSIAFHITETKNEHGLLNANLYYSHVFPQIFEHHSYSITLALLVQFVSITSTFSWTYNDLFIMLLSTILAIRFKQITMRLKSFENKANTDINFWTEIREDYDRLCNLCKILEDRLSLIVLLAFATNLFFILVQLFHSLRVIKDPVQKVYFYYSFGFLIFRTVAISLYAASINDESKEPAYILHSVPSSVYNNEINRLLLQISFDNVALSGSKMFKVTRGLILSIAGAIVTYELVLIQFNTSNIN